MYENNGKINQLILSLETEHLRKSVNLSIFNVSLERNRNSNVGWSFVLIEKRVIQTSSEISICILRENATPFLTEKCSFSWRKVKLR